VLLLLGVSVASLLTNVNFFAELGLGTAETLFLGDADLLFDVGVAVLGLGLGRVNGG
jgi:hypothetical protein